MGSEKIDGAYQQRNKPLWYTEIAFHAQHSLRIDRSLVPRLCLGTHCPRGSASLINNPILSPTTATIPRFRPKPGIEFLIDDANLTIATSNRRKHRSTPPFPHRLVHWNSANELGHQRIRDARDCYGCTRFFATLLLHIR